MLRLKQLVQASRGVVSRWWRAKFVRWREGAGMLREK